MHLKSKASNSRQHLSDKHRLEINLQNEGGFALPIVLIVGLFMLISGFTLSMQTFRSLSTARKGTHQQQAQYIAETGIAEIIEQLNSDYRYLMVNCYKRNQDAIFDPLSICGSREIGGWGQNESPLPRTPMAACLGNNNGNERNFSNYSENIILEQEIGQANGGVDNKSIKGKWQLETYSFYGNHANGGKGIIQVRGTRTNRDNQVLATSVINKTILIKSKPCSRRLLDEFDPNHFPSLLARTIDIGSDDVIGKNTANVYCTSCASNEDIDDCGPPRPTNLQRLSIFREPLDLRRNHSLFPKPISRPTAREFAHRQHSNHCHREDSMFPSHLPDR